uniref:Uncharacterized protein n=1 Tax=Mesocestoides corti TaxID=53468 RepID=A0A5K3G1A3_MESCO
MDNALRLYMLAGCLGCVTLTTWCIEYLRPRVSRLDFRRIWSIANATKNSDLLSIFGPVIRFHMGRVFFILPNFYASIEVKNRSCVGEGWKLSAIAVWFEAENRTIEEEEELGGRGRVDIAKD